MNDILNAREIVLTLTEHIRRRAQRLMGDPEVPEETVPPWVERGRLTQESFERSPVTRLERAFGLNPLEYAVVACLLAAEIEPYFRTVIRALQREGGRPWLELGTIAEMLELDRRQLPDLFDLFLPTGKLRTGGLAVIDDPVDGESPMIHLRVKATPRLLQYCLGEKELPAGMTLVDKPRALLGQSLLAEATRNELLARVRYALLLAQPLVVELDGVIGAGRKYLAEGLAAELGRPVLFVDVRRWDTRARSLADWLADVTRESALANALPYLDHWHAAMDDDDLGRAAAPQTIDPEDPPAPPSTKKPLPPPLAQFLERHQGVVFLGSRERTAHLDRLRAAVLHVTMPFPGPTQRGMLWQRAVQLHNCTIAQEVDIEALGRKFALDPGRIAAAARSAVETARARHPDGPPPVLGRDDLFTASRQQLEHELASLAVRHTKAHRWEDLVIPVEVYESLQELLARVRHAGLVYEQQGFASRHSITPGLSALFAGPPGTGKTMCASVVARELDMELFRVDLSRVVSKWIGETEKNLGKVFDEAERSHAVILFDEADSLFAKRTEVKSSVDRYANLEVSYLLQRMEAFSGVTILTTNFEDTIDPAFKRRITFKCRFERPDADARAALWRKMFPPQASLADGIDWNEIASFELSGGSIRNAAIRAAFLAADEGVPIRHDHVFLAAVREAREMGALVSDRPRDDDETEREQQAAAGPGDGNPDDEAPTPPPRRSPIVPITHPRRR